MKIRYVQITMYECDTSEFENDETLNAIRAELDQLTRGSLFAEMFWEIPHVFSSEHVRDMYISGVRFEEEEAAML